MFAYSSTEFLVRYFVVGEQLVTVSRDETFERISDEHELEVVVKSVSDLLRLVSTQRFDVAVQESFTVDSEEVEVSGLVRSELSSQHE